MGAKILDRKNSERWADTTLGRIYQSLTGVQAKKRLKVESSGSFQPVLLDWKDETPRFGTAGEVRA